MSGDVARCRTCELWITEDDGIDPGAVETTHRLNRTARRCLLGISSTSFSRFPPAPCWDSTIWCVRLVVHCYLSRVSCLEAVVAVTEGETAIQHSLISGLENGLHAGGNKGSMSNSSVIPWSGNSRLNILVSSETSARCQNAD